MEVETATLLIIECRSVRHPPRSEPEGKLQAISCELVFDFFMLS